jgi:eukaryotic-like serine/threonine-protein kinase
MRKPERAATTQEIFLRALDVPPTARSAFLDQACRDDLRLRQEVDSLLQHHRTHTLVDAAVPLNKPFVESAWSVTTQSLTTGAAALASTILGGRWRRAAACSSAVIVLIGVAYFTRDQVRKTSEAQVQDQLRVVLNADVLAVETWIDAWRKEANTWAGNPAVRSLAEELVKKANGDPKRAKELGSSPEMKEFTDLFVPFLQGTGEPELVLLDREGLRIGTGRRSNERAGAMMISVLAGQTKFAAPSRMDSWSPDRPKDPRLVSFVVAPMRNSSRNIFGALVLGRIGGYGLGDLLNVGRMGKTGETYAISSESVMLSESRFDDQLKKIGLVPNEPAALSALTVQIRDPGGDMTAGYNPSLEKEARPQTLIARLALASRYKLAGEQMGTILTPYRDYRGVEVIGAWKWLPEHDFGIITEVDAMEAFASLRYLSRAFYALFGTLGLFVGLTLLASISLARVRQREPRLGQYLLSQQIGQGGTSKVFLAHHALLKRPTAVKVLTPSEELPKEAIQRFEREVQAACRLTHPNTIEIYDFGRAANGTFYYAMEYLPGVTLAELVALDGPIPAGRLVHIMKQACASLREAHGMGLVHRDIKPQNIMLCERGGEYDFVKVLDFGLVWNVADSEDMRITRPHRIIGTPLYMAPERFSSPLEADPRSDIYSLGAVAYHLLSGRPVFRGVSDLQLLGQVMHATPDRLSEVVTSPLPEALERLVMDCIARDISQRPQSVAAILEILDAIENVPPWTQEMAKAWWVRCAPGSLEAQSDTQPK